MSEMADEIKSVLKLQEDATNQYFDWVKTMFITSSGMIAGMSIFLLGTCNFNPKEPILLWTLLLLILSACTSLWGLSYKHKVLFRISQKSAVLLTSKEPRGIVEVLVPPIGNILCIGSAILYSIAILSILYCIVIKLLTLTNSHP
jgi:hypothetical protein